MSSGSIRANRTQEAPSCHVPVRVFFIFLVANIGGSLTLSGDPLLLLGFLQGIAFGWPFKHMIWPMLFGSALLLGVFYALDRHFWARDGGPRRVGPPRVGFRGLQNLLFLAVAADAALMSGLPHRCSLTLQTSRQSRHHDHTA